ncbi:MAG: hypothetical protein Kow0069_22200 [Promethearchaeota archaeon]
MGFIEALTFAELYYSPRPVPRSRLTPLVVEKLSKMGYAAPKVAFDHHLRSLVKKGWVRASLRNGERLYVATRKGATSFLPFARLLGEATGTTGARRLGVLRRQLLFRFLSKHGDDDVTSVLSGDDHPGDGSGLARDATAKLVRHALEEFNEVLATATPRRRPLAPKLQRVALKEAFQFNSRFVSSLLEYLTGGQRLAVHGLGQVEKVAPTFPSLKCLLAKVHQCSGGSNHRTYSHELRVLKNLATKGLLELDVGKSKTGWKVRVTPKGVAVARVLRGLTWQPRELAVWLERAVEQLRLIKTLTKEAARRSPRRYASSLKRLLLDGWLVAINPDPENGPPNPESGGIVRGDLLDALEVPVPGRRAYSRAKDEREALLAEDDDIKSFDLPRGALAHAYEEGSGFNRSLDFRDPLSGVSPGFFPALTPQRSGRGKSPSDAAAGRAQPPLGPPTVKEFLYGVLARVMASPNSTADHKRAGLLAIFDRVAEDVRTSLVEVTRNALRDHLSDLLRPIEKHAGGAMVKDWLRALDEELPEFVDELFVTR